MPLLVFTMSSPNRPPATKEEVASETAGQEPVTEETAVSEPAGHEPPSHEPVITEPAVHQPALEETAADKPETDDGNTIRIGREYFPDMNQILIILQDDNNTDSAFGGDS